ncbi:SgcJ/EcaC family oxidoreductase [Rhizomonospora bruguierae]|uniref:SgcJ/EcaC family oxidoreductase n=1 Tax=Rhizomonospora bruguierae TaxID=1581705 RepID=UPI001BD0CDFD|nr:SgcJ/EcaC family oxidoreductase [Micromonospora sp. NBRC 107566]
MSTSSQSTATADDVVLHRVLERTSEAWARSDAGAFAAAFSPSTNVVIAGSYLLGRDAVRDFIGAAFAGPMRGTRVVIDPVYLKRFAPDVALVVTEGGVLLPGESEVAPGRGIRGTWLLGRVDEQWQVAAYHSSPIPAG